MRTRATENKKYISLLDSAQFELLVLELFFSQEAFEVKSQKITIYDKIDFACFFFQLSLETRISLLTVFIDLCNKRIAADAKMAPRY